MVTGSPRPVLVDRGLRFAEGINFDQDGTLYCVDWLGGGIWRMPPGGPLAEWVRTGGNPNGTRFGPDGDLFVADAGLKAILRISPRSGELAIHLDRFGDEPLLGPNDLCSGPDGTLYFTDPGDSSSDKPYGAAYAAAPDGTVERVATGLALCNGLAVTPDSGALIVAETYTGILHRYDLTTRHGELYAELPALVTLSPAHGPDAEGRNDAGPDGMAFGADGNLYVAHAGSGEVRVIDLMGRIVAGLPAGGPGPTNVAFWQDSLYVTEGWGGAVYRLDIGVREQPPFMRPW